MGPNNILELKHTHARRLRNPNRGARELRLVVWLKKSMARIRFRHSGFDDHCGDGGSANINTVLQPVTDCKIEMPCDRIWKMSDHSI
jgi:hypothetical protein